MWHSFSYVEWNDSSNLSSSDNSVAGIPETIILWSEISNILWWFVVVASGVSSLLYLYVGGELVRKGRHRKQPVLFAIVCCDTVMLAVMGLGTVLQRYAPRHHFLGTIICTIMAFVSNSAGMFTNWCWLTLWGSRYLAVFYPLQQIRWRHSTCWLLPLLFLVSIGSEAWTLVLTTEYNFGGVTLCGLNVELANYRVLKWVILIEATTSYFLPFVLIGCADAMVFCGAHTGGLTAISSDNMKQPRISIPESAKIVPRNYEKRSKQKRHRILMRTILAATLDLALNLPDYALQIIDNFVPLQNIIDDDQTKHIIEAVAFILYYCQYPLIVYYLRVLIIEMDASSQSSSARVMIFKKHSQSEQAKRSCGSASGKKDSLYGFQTHVCQESRLSHTFLQVDEQSESNTNLIAQRKQAMQMRSVSDAAPLQRIVEIKLSASQPDNAVKHSV